MNKEFNEKANQSKYPFVLPSLPFDKSAFGKIMSSETFDYHHGKHHNTYVVNANKLIEENSSFHSKSLEEIMIETFDKSDKVGIYNNVSQIWNHSFLWHSITPNQTSPKGELLEKINNDFESLDSFKAEFKKAALAQFGSGWAWLCLDGENLKIIKSSNADSPIVKGLYPLLTCDVWEHAYYIDYRNVRADYLDNFNNILNWEFAEDNFKKIM